MRQIIYYHQSLPLYEYKFSLKGHNLRSNLFYFYIYPLYVKLFLKENTYVAVQTEEIRSRFAQKFHFPLDKIGVYFPEVEKIDTEKVCPYNYEKGSYNFIYPSMGATYKEHITIVKALRCLYSKEPELARRIKVHFTLQESDNKELYNCICQYHQEDNYVFHGNMPHRQVLSMMKSCSGLLFPSVIETLGLPLLEAASLGIPIIANDLGYAREVLDGYDGVDFVAVHGYERWAAIMKACCEKKTRYQYYHHPVDDSWGSLIRKIKSASDSHKCIICVLATASAKRGALAIYNQFVNALVNHDNNAEWHIFVDLDMPMPEISHVHYHICHTKGLGRVWFDLVGLGRMLKRMGIAPDAVFSLQNTGAFIF